MRLGAETVPQIVTRGHLVDVSAQNLGPGGVVTLKHLLPKLGCHSALIPNQIARDERIPVAGVAHQSGTVRFGHDPASSVLDVECKAHDLDNLYVVDTSFFPSASAVNPALTAMANALRVGDHLLGRLGVADAVTDDKEVAVS